MEKTINEIKKNAKTLKNDILKLISDFEAANPEVDIRVTVGRSYSGNDTNSHNVDICTTIK